ncbi:MAG: nicotinate phosphoribosyltransferase [Candidatus Izemoplasmatales bacterium]|nr:nicotinate phosphoribosyltransferase [bacterium]MDZ4196503.1 nicotinate phosphoribosyltransferase [Candidatus Izemoplasmatales bacterium]
MREALLVDFYELTMANGYFEAGKKDEVAMFDLYFRSVPDSGGYVICAGLEQVVHYLQNLRFDDNQIEYLRNKKLFSERFLCYLKEFRFTGDVDAVKEGSVVFPNEPLLTVTTTLIEAQLIETALLLYINHQSLIATKAQRIVRSAEGRSVFEFGTRRAHGSDAAVLGARAAYIGGVHGTSCALADIEYLVPAMGTMAHSWVQLFPTELEAFFQYAKTYPRSTTLLVDTYNVLQSGIPNAIKTVQAVLWPLGIKKAKIRIDSGDLAYLAMESRKLLDHAGCQDVQILVSNSLDETSIADLLRQGAPIDGFGVGERLITAKSDPVFGGVYKLVATVEEGKVIPKIKISENPDKIPTPGAKRWMRLYATDTKKAIADYLMDASEALDSSKPLTLFDPVHTWKQKTITHYTAKEMRVPIFRKGQLVYALPSLEEIRAFRQTELDSMWAEVLRLQNPHKYYVDLSLSLWTMKETMIQTHRFHTVEE